MNKELKRSGKGIGGRGLFSGATGPRQTGRPTRLTDVEGQKSSDEITLVSRSPVVGLPGEFCDTGQGGVNRRGTEKIRGKRRTERKGRGSESLVDPRPSGGGRRQDVETGNEG